MTLQELLAEARAARDLVCALTCRSVGTADQETTQELSNAWAALKAACETLETEASA